VILDALPDPVTVKDAAGIYRFANAAFCELVGRPQHEIIGQTDRALFPPGQASDRHENDELALSSGSAVTTTEKTRAPDRERWLRTTRQPLTKPDGRTVGLLHVVQDVTATKQSREELGLFFQAVEQSPSTVVITDTSGAIQYVNRKFAETSGYSREEVIGQNPRLLKSGEMAPSEYRRLWETISAGHEWRGEFHNKKKNGELYWESAVISPVFDEAGAISHFLAIKEDITERKSAEEALRAAHRQLELLLATVPSILIGADQNGIITQWNRAAEHTFAIPASKVIGRPFKQCGIRWHMVDVLEGTADSLASAGCCRLDDVWFLRPDGTEGILGITITPLLDDGGQVAGFVLLASDVTHRKALESQLRHAQKLESIGQLAAGIAHEINTPTQYVGDNTRFLQDSFTELTAIFHHFKQILAEAAGGPLPTALLEAARTAAEQADLDYLEEEIPLAIAQSLEGIERVSKIVRAMKDFSHPGSTEKVATDLNRAIESTITVSRNEWKYVSEMDTDLEPALPLVPCLPAELNQVILNLITNAAYAIARVVGDDGKKGTITISTRRDGDWAEIRVADTGTGIPPEVQPKVFDPFFTTKEVGKGTGQGLAISHAVIVDKHGGTIHFETTVGQGTTFVIRLPLHPRAHQEVPR
jgi:PAS domain S-box-containing protein